MKTEPCTHPTEKLVKVQICDPNSDVCDIYIDGDEVLSECGSIPEFFTESYGNLAIYFCAECLQLQNLTVEAVAKEIEEMRRENEENAEKYPYVPTPEQAANTLKLKQLGQVLKIFEATVIEMESIGYWCPDSVKIKTKNGSIMRIGYDAFLGRWALA